MSQLTERELARVLRDQVPEPEPSPDRARSARARARGIRVRNRLAVSCAAVAVAAAVGVPALLPGDGGGGQAPAWPSLSESPGTVRESIRRPLDLPSVDPGERCPTSPFRTLPQGAGFSSPHPAIGEGPLHIAGAVGPEGASVIVAPADSGWLEAKVIWVFAREYAGPLLLRGGRIDGPGPLGFDHYIGAADYDMGAGGGPHEQVLYPRDGLDAPATGQLTSYPGGIYAKAPGCYAIQADGEGFSQTLVFEVRVGESVTAGRSDR